MIHPGGWRERDLRRPMPYVYRRRYDAAVLGGMPVLRLINSAARYGIPWYPKPKASRRTERYGVSLGGTIEAVTRSEERGFRSGNRSDDEVYGKIRGAQ
ncbi:hypothetical protein KCP71_25665 [Salmonella enterica subsp. enterica]|nr:hypothetical protein KCP71_25665 [Salmonella enterica subsp. enterica]